MTANPAGTRTALIVGAGIGGLATGVALRRIGWRVRIFERTSSPRELGFALNLAANAMVALEELGLADRVAAGGHHVQTAEIRRGDGTPLKRVNLPRAIDGARAVVATRPVLHGALLEAVDARDLVTGSAATSFEVIGNRVRLVLASGSDETGDLLVGADGVASAMRRQIHPQEPPPRRSGYFAIRGVAKDAAPLMRGISAATYLGRGIEASLAQAGSNAVYWYMSLLADEVRAGAMGPAAVAARFGSRLDDTFRAVVAATDQASIRLDELFDRDPIESWGTGPVTLLGDAAHPMLPHTGQGAAQAIEDAIALSLALTDAGDIPAALRRYERVRAARTRRLIERGRRAAWATTTENTALTWLRSILIGLVPAPRMAAMFMLAGEKDPHHELRRTGGTT